MGNIAAKADVAVPLFIDPNASSQALSDIPVRSVRFLTTDDFPPFNFIGPTGTLTGFNIELARAICAEINARCTVQALPWDQISKAIEERKGDAVIAGMAPTTNALKKFSFTRAYFKFPARFFGPMSGALSNVEIVPQVLKQREVAVQANTQHWRFLKQHFPDTKLRLFQTERELYQAVSSGEALLGFGDGMRIAFWLQSAVARNCCKLAGGAYHSRDFFGAGMSIAIPQNRQDLKAVIDAALNTLSRSGKHRELFLRYFPVNPF